MVRFFLTIMVLVSLCSYAHSTQIILQPGSEGIDTAFGSGGDYYPNSNGMHVANLEDNGYIYRALLKFDLSGVSFQEVDSAILYLGFGNSVAGGGQNGAVSLNRVTDDWAEDTARWSNQPNITGDGVVTKMLPSSGRSVEAWDITDFINGWLDGSFQNYGMMISTAYGGNYNKHGLWSSDESDPNKRPKLVLSLEDSSVPEPLTILLFITGLMGINLRKRLKN